MKKLLVMFILIGILVISGIANAEEIISSKTYLLGSTYARSYQWTPIFNLDLTSLTSGISSRSIAICWRSRSGVAEAVRLYKDGVYSEIDLTNTEGYSAIFTDPAVMGISYNHTWGVQFKVSYALYTYVWIDDATITFTGPAVMEVNPPVEY